MDQSRVNRGRPDGGQWAATSKNEATGSLLGGGTATLVGDSYEERAQRETVRFLTQRRDRDIALRRQQVDAGELVTVVDFDFDSAYDEGVRHYTKVFYQRDECARYFEAGHGHRDDAAYEEIWRGERGGASGDYIRDRYALLEEQLEGLHSGTVEPSAVLGSAAPSDDETRVRAVAQVEADIAYFARAIRTEGRSMTENQGVVDLARKKAQPYPTEH